MSPFILLAKNLGCVVIGRNKSTLKLSQDYHVVCYGNPSMSEQSSKSPFGTLGQSSTNPNLWQWRRFSNDSSLTQDLSHLKHIWYMLHVNVYDMSCKSFLIHGWSHLRTFDSYETISNICLMHYSLIWKSLWPSIQYEKSILFSI
jgi:hypothetical protein